jgi:hypothetical protein
MASATTLNYSTPDSFLWHKLVWLTLLDFDLGWDGSCAVHTAASFILKSCYGYNILLPCSNRMLFCCVVFIILVSIDKSNCNVWLPCFVIDWAKDVSTSRQL